MSPSNEHFDSTGQTKHGAPLRESVPIGDYIIISL